VICLGLLSQGICLGLRLRYHITGPASPGLPEQISPEHGCWMLLLVPLYTARRSLDVYTGAPLQADTSGPLPSHMHQGLIHGLS